MSLFSAYCALAGDIAFQPYIHSFTAAALLMKSASRYEQENYISDSVLYKQVSSSLVYDGEKSTKINPCHSYPVTCPNGKSESSDQNKDKTESQSAGEKNQQPGTTAQAGAGKNLKKTSFCGAGGSDDPDPPEDNQDDTTEKYGAECLPVWQDDKSVNTVVFIIETKNLRIPDMSSALGHNTPAATVYINGQPVTFYIRWGFNENADPFLVARGPDWKSQHKSEAMSAPLQLLKFLLELHSSEATKDNAPGASPAGVSGVTVRGGQPMLIIGGDGTMFNLNEHPTLDIPAIALDTQPAPSEAEAVNPAAWSQTSTWSIQVTDESNSFSIELDGISFQDQADTFLWDGHAMDGWRADELGDHLRKDHNIPVDGTIRAINDLPTVPDCHYCNKIKSQNALLKAFWGSLEALMNSEDCPDKLLFKVTVGARPV